MRYQPTNMKDRSHVGKKWNRYYLRSMQLILHATHGIVSGAPAFFRRAFGATADEFKDLLIKPHKFIFNRDWFEELEGRPELDAYHTEFRRLSPADRADLLQALSGFDTCGRYQAVRANISNTRVASIFRFYQPLDDEEEADMWRRQKELRAAALAVPVAVPDDQRVEDACLELDPILEKK